MAQEDTPESTKFDPYKEQFSDFISDFMGESDRACVMLSSAKLETLLRNLIEKFLVPIPTSEDDLLDGDAPLSTFSARIRAVHRLGLIDDQFAKLLHIFRRLRNSFAHEITSSDLCSGSARDRVLALTEPFTDSPFFRSIVNLSSKTTGRDPEDPGVLFRAIVACFYMHLHITYKSIKTLTANSKWTIKNFFESIELQETERPTKL